MCWNKKIPSRNGVMNQSITQEMYSYTISVPRGTAEKWVCLPGISSVPPLVCLNRSPSTWTFGHRTSEKQKNKYTIIPRKHIILEAAELTKADLGFVQALHILNTLPLPCSPTSSWTRDPVHYLWFWDTFFCLTRQEDRTDELNLSISWDNTLGLCLSPVCKSAWKSQKNP